MNMKKLRKKDVEGIAYLRGQLLDVIRNQGSDMPSSVALAALMELTVDVALVITGGNKSRTLSAISEMVNTLMLRKHK